LYQSAVIRFAPSRLTPEGERVARQLAMTDEAGQDALMAALLGE
jgi:hypothetical protein